MEPTQEKREQHTVHDEGNKRSPTKNGSDEKREENASAQSSAVLDEPHLRVDRETGRPLGVRRMRTWTIFVNS